MLHDAAHQAFRKIAWLSRRSLQSASVEVVSIDSMPSDGPSPFLVSQQVVLTYDGFFGKRHKVLYDEPLPGFEDESRDMAHLLCSCIEAHLRAYH